VFLGVRVFFWWYVCVFLCLVVEVVFLMGVFGIVVGFLLSVVLRFGFVYGKFVASFLVC